MAGIGDILRQIHLSAQQSAEAIAALRRVQDELSAAMAKLGEARDTIDAVNAEVTSETLTEYSTMLEAAHEVGAGLTGQTENVISTIEEALESGERYINKLYG